MHRPLISVIVPARDQAPFIADSMTSLTRQFDDPSVMEILLVDDGSTDGTGELAAAYAGRLPGLKILRNEQPAGLAAARNRGLDAATGRYIAFLDPDDWYAPGHLARLTAEIHRLGVDFVRTDHIRHTDGVRTVHRAPQARHGVALDPRADIGPVHATTMVDYPYAPFGIFDGALRDAGLLHFPDGLQTAEDRPWIWRLHLKASSYAVVDAPGAFYRRGMPGSLSQVFDRRQLDFLRSYREVFTLVGADPEAERFRPKAVRQFLAIACHHVDRSSRMDRGVRRQLRSGIRDTVAGLPAGAARAGLADLDPKRRKVLTKVLRSTL
ncbi:glycosyltransferase family 2 protein [Arthrobacter mobilis]|uniref:Glycosyltransferase family 2 protein n=1 Tax=Arthrobacter mobilis TaxID=2724944 RepID=A0A7X6K6U2_9MICC|nr:glycosyltransferase family 2 protein [Arthrobacter mobilis]NKX55598.1 glycosyltransferase family 2 protein [Arthrobacter mobilis]